MLQRNKDLLLFTTGVLTITLGVPAITLGVPAITAGVPAITAGVSPSRSLSKILRYRASDC